MDVTIPTSSQPNLWESMIRTFPFIIKSSARSFSILSRCPERAEMKVDDEHDEIGTWRQKCALLNDHHHFATTTKWHQAMMNSSQDEMNECLTDCQSQLGGWWASRLWGWSCWEGDGRRWPEGGGAGRFKLPASRSSSELKFLSQNWALTNPSPSHPACALG